MESYYKVVSHPHVFGVVVRKEHDREVILFGGKRECINISIEQHDKYATIRGLSHKAECVLEGIFMFKAGIDLYISKCSAYWAFWNVSFQTLL